MIEVGNKFWNLRGPFKVLLGLIDAGTHMSFIKLNNGKFLVVDTIGLDATKKAEVDALTNGGELIEAVIATHPHHTLYFPAFYELYPNAAYYGTPRHMKIFPNIPWKGDVANEDIRKMWESDGVFIRIPEGADFIDPPEGHHFTSAFVFHQDSRTLHVDDTIIYIEHSQCVLSCVGVRSGKMSLWPGDIAANLYPTAESPNQFKEWLEKLINDWDFDNICTAHIGMKIGGAKEDLKKVLASYGPFFEKIAKQNAKKQSSSMKFDKI